MNANCAKCGGPIGRQIGPGGRRKYCPTCSPQRDRPERRKSKRTPLTLTTGQPQQAATTVLEATRNALTDAGVQDTSTGRCAQILAARIDAGDETATGLVALTKELRATLNAALAEAPHEEDNIWSRLEAMRQGRYRPGSSTNVDTAPKC
jgi:hypothetical protein